ncbi:hypothetical protein TNCV_507041 [Trichonephila clavipes]|nr:hypothetical protein TNCV_507041 [Trichonephila clavipes]
MCGILWGDVLQHAYIIRRTPNNSNRCRLKNGTPTARNVAPAGSEAWGHGTTPVRVKENIEDVSSELGNGD